jgi:hypothetical protein
MTYRYWLIDEPSKDLLPAHLPAHRHSEERSDEESLFVLATT